MNYLKIEQGQAVEVFIKKYVGKIDSEYQGNVTTKHRFDVEVAGEPFTYDMTERTVGKMKENNIKPGMSCIIERGFYQGKTFYNVHPLDDAMGQAKLQEAKQTSKEIKQDSNNRNDEIRYGMCCNIASRQFPSLDEKTLTPEQVKLRVNSIYVLANELYRTYKLPEELEEIPVDKETQKLMDEAIEEPTLDDLPF